MKNKIKIYTIIIQLIFILLLIRLFLIGEIILALYQIGFIIIAELILIFTYKNYQFNKIRLFTWILILIHELGILGLYNLYGFDTLLHLSWSILLGFIFSKYFYKLNYKRKKLSLIVISLIIIVGISWEIVEFSWDLFFIKYSNFGVAQPSHLDTLKDLIVNIIGAFLGHFINLRLINFKSSSSNRNIKKKTLKSIS